MNLHSDYNLSPPLDVSRSILLEEPTNKNQLVLLVDDQPSILEMTTCQFQNRGHRVVVAFDFEDVAKTVYRNKEPMWACVDLNLKQQYGDNSGASILSYLHTAAHNRVVGIGWTGEEDLCKWRDAMRAGAAIVVPKLLGGSQHLVTIVEESPLLRDACEAATDSMTGLPNFKEFKRVVLRELRLMRDRAYTDHLVLMVFDLDRFKGINDIHGHRCGDQAIRLAADVLRSCTKENDYICRMYKGDEFMLVMPSGIKQEAYARGLLCQQELAKWLEQNPLLGKDNRKVDFGLSFGVAQLNKLQLKNARTDRELENLLGSLIQEADTNGQHSLKRAKDKERRRWPR